MGDATLLRINGKLRNKADLSQYNLIEVTK